MKKFITAVALVVMSLSDICAAALPPADAKVTVNFVDIPAEQVLKSVDNRASILYIRVKMPANGPKSLSRPAERGPMRS